MYLHSLFPYPSQTVDKLVAIFFKSYFLTFRIKSSLDFFFQKSCKDNNEDPIGSNSSPSANILQKLGTLFCSKKLLQHNVINRDRDFFQTSLSFSLIPFWFVELAQYVTSYLVITSLYAPQLRDNLSGLYHFSQWHFRRL